MPTKRRAKVEKPTLTDIIMLVPWQKFSSQLVYIVLLIAFLVIGYLFGKMEGTKEAASLAAVAPQAPAAAAPQAPAVPSPAEVMAKLTAGTYPPKGNQNAKVTVTEFADFRCPFCEKFFTDSESQLMKDYVDTGKVKFVFRNYAFLGPASTVAANAAECANDQGKFWEMHDYFYKNQPAETDTSMYTVDNLTQIAGTLGMDTNKFHQCLSTNEFDKNQAADLAEGQSIGVSGTPTFYINGVQLVGAQPYSAIKTVIDQELAKAK